MPEFCPRCKSDEIAGEENNEEYSFKLITLPVHCERCGFRWLEHYVLKGWEPDVPDETKTIGGFQK